MLQEHSSGIAGCICRGHPQEPGVRRLSFARDGKPPMGGDVPLVTAPGGQEQAGDVRREDSAGLSGGGVLLPCARCIPDAEYQPGDWHLSLVGQRPGYQRHL